MSRQLELALEHRGEASANRCSGEARAAMHGNGRSGTDRLMEQVGARGTVKAALKRVRQNKGSPGVDGMTVDELPTYLAQNWEGIRSALLAGAYQPMPVREAEIPKSGGGVRKLGIPATLDWFIQ
jgi:RNA-directed DNA polymerase